MQNKINIRALKYGETFIDEGMAYRGGDRAVKIPISLIIYLIEAGERKILVDSGCDTMPGFELSNFCSPVEVVKRAGLECEDITDLILTHAHHDHAEATHYFKNATVHVEVGELDAARRYIPAKMTVNAFTDECDLGNGVRAVKIGGHSKGSCIVEIELGEKTCVICGDECYVKRCLDEKIPTGASFCPEKSLEFVKKYGSDSYITLLCHDGEILKGSNGVFEIADI